MNNLSELIKFHKCMAIRKSNCAMCSNDCLAITSPNEFLNTLKTLLIAEIEEIEVYEIANYRTKEDDEMVKLEAVKQAIEQLFSDKGE